MGGRRRRSNRNRWTGCVKTRRLFASEKSGVKDLKNLKDLKGKTIATFVMGASPQTVLQVSIFKAGVDPNAKVNWKVAPFDRVGETVARGEADAGIHIDPWAWSASIG
jgi:NitT/TauT family transport system substrate-binding protein